MAKPYSLNKTKFLTDDEASHLEIFLRAKLNGSECRDALVLLLGLRTGARAKEILNIRRDDFTFETKSILIRGLKGSNDREIPLPIWLARAFRDYLKGLKGNIPFDIGYFRLRHIWFAFRPVKKKLHSLRHTFAIKVYKATKDIHLVKVAMGHRSINNTLIYLDFVYTTEQLQKIIF